MGASEYAGLTPVVTGGASGIGLATARLLAAREAHVACLDLKPDDVPTLLAGIPADVAVRTAVEGAARRLCGIDILVGDVGNVGIGAQGSIEASTDDERHRVFEVNVIGIVRARSPVPPQVQMSPSTATFTDHGSGAAPDLRHETVRKENQP
ncbi:SDR family NAD(P)-dependent oxidoreductase [Streptomyces albicerus]|uniref:SDR family NAD(P)-dependent oxidoreductase n=1 Tax=Streptomyces albicerus TaxID=2569859 RepID=UPI00124B6A3B|nr:SDR family NAD(P)-dependent oxidoreductase [Streptomyces albicerus]